MFTPHRQLHRRVLTGLGGALLVAAGLPALISGPVNATTASPAASGVPRPDHVVIVIFENTSAGSILGNPQAPYFNQLANSGANFTNSKAIEHPSEPNYLDLFSGSNQGVSDDSCPHTFSTANEGSQLIAAGLTFKGYSEDLPSAGSTTCSSGGYARKHNPWANFSNVPATSNQPFTAFPTDFTQLPTVSWVVPNLCDDIHDCSIATGDTWFRNHMDAYVQWAKTHNSVLITTFDENDGSSGNQIATFFNGQPVKAGTYSEPVNHFSVLRTIEDMYGLPYAGSAAGATSITDAWGTPANTMTVTNPRNQTSTVNTAASLQVHATDSDSGQTLTYSATGLPAGLSISSSTGLISGTPTATGTSSVTVKATDTVGVSGTASFTWTVNPVSGGCDSTQLLGNPGFETGSAAPWTVTPAVIDNSSSEPAHSGSWKAWLDGYGTTHTDTLAQQITIPTGCTTASFSFWLHVDTSETTTAQSDKLQVQVLDSAGTVVGALDTFSNLNHDAGYDQHTYSLTSYIGQTISLEFTGTENSSAQTSFVIDDIGLNVS